MSDLYPSLVQVAEELGLHDVERLSEQQLIGRVTRRFLSAARRDDPARYRDLARRFPVLGTKGIDSRRRHERDVAEVALDLKAAYREWQASQGS